MWTYVLHVNTSFNKESSNRWEHIFLDLKISRLYVWGFNLTTAGHQFKREASASTGTGRRLAVPDRGCSSINGLV